MTAERLAGAARGVMRLGRPANIATVWSGVLAAACLAGASGSARELFGLAAAMSLASFAGAALNDAYDAPLDAAAAAGLVAQLALWPKPGGWAALGAALLLSGTIVLFDTARKDDPAAPLLMGLCRGLLYVTCAVAVSGGLNGRAAFGAALLLAYTVGLTAATREGREPRFWPVLMLMSPFAATVPLLGGSSDHCVLWLFALAWVTRCAILLMNGDLPRSIGGLVAAICLLDALLIALHDPSQMVWTAAAGFPLTLLLQRVAPAG